MKKILLSLAIASTMLVANAQENMMSKRNTPILPEAGDWSVGINVDPFLYYIGNMFNDNSNNASPSWDYVGAHPLVLNAKYVKDETTAYRAYARITFGSTTFTPTPDTSVGSVKDTTLSTFGVVLGLGIQKSRGKGRLKGIYGAEATVSFGNKPGQGTTKIEYNGTPFAGSITERKDGSGFGIGVRGFLGVEYFFAPKMSLSAEYGWGITFESIGAGSQTVADGAGGTKSTDTGKQSTFGANVDNGNGSVLGRSGGFINFNFYF